MRKSLLIATFALLGNSPVFAADGGGALTGKELREAVSGKTVYIQTPIGAEIPIRYRPNGTMTGSSSRQLAMLAGEDVNKDRGRWWVKGSQLCQKWQNWSEGRAYCYRFRATSGTHVHWSRADGQTGTARLSN